MPYRSFVNNLIWSWKCQNDLSDVFTIKKGLNFMKQQITIISHPFQVGTLESDTWVIILITIHHGNPGSID